MLDLTSGTRIEIGKYNDLRAIRATENGMYVGHLDEEVLLPKKYVPAQLKVGDSIKVFVYKDSEDRLIATTERPYVILGQFAYLRVKDVNQIGAFLDWGLEKDLLVPYSQQSYEMKKNESYLVYLYLDETTERLVASSKIKHFIEQDNIDLEEGQEVDILIGGGVGLGYRAIINQQYLGLIYRNEIFQNLKPGDKTKAWVKLIRPDKKIDLTLQKPGFAHIEDSASFILNHLKALDGFLPLHDKSSPEEITRQLQMSKKAFKKAIGTLYKQRLIKIEEDGIRLA